MREAAGPIFVVGLVVYIVSFFTKEKEGAAAVAE